MKSWIRVMKWFVASAILCLSAHAGWQLDELISGNNFQRWNTREGFDLRPDGTPCLAYGGDHLRFASFSGTAWTREIIDQRSDTGFNPCVIASENGDIHIVYHKGKSSGDLRYAYRPAGSDQWQIDIIDSQNFAWTSMIQDDAGNLHLALTGSSGMGLYYMTRQGNLWTKEVIEENTNRISYCNMALNNAQEPVITYCKNGEVYIAYRTPNGWESQWVYVAENLVKVDSVLLFDSNDLPHLILGWRSLHHIYWSPDGWQVENLNQILGTAKICSAVMDSTDKIHLIFRTKVSDIIRYMVQTDDGWDFSDTNDDLWTSALKLDPSGTPYIAGYNGYGNAEMRVIHRSGSDWISETVDVADDYRSSELRDTTDIEMDSAGHPHLLYCYHNDLHHYWYDGMAWNDEIVLSDAYADGFTTDLAIESNGTLHACFSRSDLVSNCDGWYAVNNGAGWVVEYIPIQGLRPHAIALTDDGIPYITGYDEYNGDMYFIRKDAAQEWIFNPIELDTGYLNYLHGDYSDLAIDSSGQVHVSYFHELEADLKYAVGFDNTWTIETVDGDDGRYRGYHNRMILDSNDEPYIAYGAGSIDIAHKTGGIWEFETGIIPSWIDSTSILLDSENHLHVAGNNAYAFEDDRGWSIEYFDMDQARWTALTLDENNIPWIGYTDGDDDFRCIHKDPDTPDVTAISPNAFSRENSYSGVTITGNHFTGSTLLDLGYGIVIDDWDVLNDTTISADITVLDLADRGVRSITVGRSDAEAVCCQCLEVFFGTPVILDVSPATYPKNTTVDVIITGRELEFITEVDFQQGITINGMEELSDHELKVNITIDAEAAEGFRNVSVTTPSGTAVCDACFNVEMALTSLYSFGVDSIPEQLYTDTPFLLRIRALDYFERQIPTWSGTVNVYDSATYSLLPSTVDLVNGVGQVDATIAGSSAHNWIEVSGATHGESNQFNVVKSIAECEYEYLETPPHPAYFMQRRSNNPILVLPDGTLQVIFGNDNLWSARNEGAGWNITRIDSQSGAGNAASMAMDSDGFPHVSYIDPIKKTLKYARLTAYGWSIEEVDSDAHSYYETAIGVGSDGVPHICYPTESGEFYVTKSGNDWIKLQLDSDPANDCSLVVDGLNRPHMVYHFSGIESLDYAGYLNDTWQTMQLAHGRNGYLPSIAVDSENNPHVVWTYSVYGGTKLYHQYWQNTAWVQEQIPGSEGCIDASLVLDSEDHLHFSSAQVEPIIGKYFVFNGSDWSSETIDPGHQYGNFVGMGLGADGVAHFLDWDADEMTVSHVKWDSGWSTDLVVQAATAGNNVSILPDQDGLPMVGYTFHVPDETNGSPNDVTTIKIARQTVEGWEFEDVVSYINHWCLTDMALQSPQQINMAIATGNLAGNTILNYAEKSGEDWIIEPVAEGESMWEIDLDNRGNGMPVIGFRREESGLGNCLYVGEKNQAGSWEFDQVQCSIVSGPSIAVDSANTIHATFSSNIDTANKLYYARNTGGAWSVEIAYGYGATVPKIAVDSQNIPHILFWADGEIRHAYLNGSAWDSETVDDDFVNSFAGLFDFIIDDQDIMHCFYGSRPQESGFDVDGRYAVKISGSWYKYTVDMNGSTAQGKMMLDADGVPYFAIYDTAAFDVKVGTCGILTAPMVDFVEPGGVYPGTHLDSAAISGIGLLATSLIDLGPGITVNSFDVIDNTLVIADIEIDSGAAPGPRNVRTITPAGTDICSECFVVLETGSQPVISSVSPDTGYQGHANRIVISGEYLDETQIVNLGSDIEITGLTIRDPGSLEVGIDIPWEATPGDRDVTVVTSSGSAVCSQCFYVEESDPPTATVTPTPSGPTSTPTATPTPSATRTHTPSPTPTSTHTRTPTPTGSVTFTPTASPSSSPSFTPTPSPVWSSSPTPTPVWTASPTPSPVPSACQSTGVSVKMPSTLFHAGDVCNCIVTVCNAEAFTLSNYPLFVILDVYGSYFFAPSFNMVFDNYLQMHNQFPPGETQVTVLDNFDWPAGVSPASNIVWYGALTNPGITELFGSYGTFSFGWE